MIAKIARKKTLYLLTLPVVLYYLIFHYIPMFGIVIAFKTYNPILGFFASPWTGFNHFISFFQSMYFSRVVKNTLLINFLQLVFAFPAPILLALFLNELKSESFKRLVQTVTYLPHFISLIVICGMVVDFVAKNGVINDVVVLLGGERANLLLNETYYRQVYLISGIWQSIGWGSIIYLAALAGINSELYEAAEIDGAGRLKKCFHVTLPGIVPTIVVMLILQIGSMMSEGPEKTLLLYNPTNYEVSDLISTFVYRKGLIENNFSYSAAIGLFNSAINFTLLVAANKASRSLTDNGLW